MLSDPLIIDILSIYFFAIALCVPMLAVLIFISSIDDLLFDILYISLRLYKRIFIYPRTPRYSTKDLYPTEEKPIAIMVPAWQEANVISRMLSHLVSNYDYENYLIFVGVYPNDPATAAAVEDLIDKDERARRHIRLVSTQTPGPTSKAQCLNKIYAHITRDDPKAGARNRIYVIHDAEDWVHPFEPWIFNRLVPQKAMIQIPVQPLFRGVLDFIGGHYADEFAESHRRDLMVREALTNGVPSAGVGCAFSDQALRYIKTLHPQGPFNENSLTEDYDLATRIHHLGFPQAFVRLPQTLKGKTKRQCVCSKALFPDELGPSVRQKARWLIGIAFQGRDEFQWSGNIFQRYMFFRDRKAIITAPLTIAAYFLLLNTLILIVAPYLWRDFPGFGVLIGQQPWLSTVLSLNVAFLALRALQRIWHVGAIYGPFHAVMSFFRIPVGNLINFLATLRAFRLYYRARREGRALAWDKTEHSFPSDLQPSGHAIVPGE